MRKTDRFYPTFRRTKEGSARLRAALISLEPWDGVWRRNQHLASRLVTSGAISNLLFVEPPAGGLALRAQSANPVGQATVITPPLLIPRRFGGNYPLGKWTRWAVRNVDLLWINDPVLGLAALRSGQSAVYDITDDWRELDQPPAKKRAIIRAENELARRGVPTIVCSKELHRRWQDRYSIDATLVPNGFDSSHLRQARPIGLAGHAPHVVYVGTLHSNRLDLALVAELAAQSLTVHLVGPDHLSNDERRELSAAGVRLEGPVEPARVADWLTSADVLICPHRVDSFTLSLDAIKAHEYLATDRPVVATRSSGFQHMTEPGLSVVTRSGFVDAVKIAASDFVTAPDLSRRSAQLTWDDRAEEFATVLGACP